MDSSPPPKRIKVCVENDTTDLAVDLWDKRPEFTDVVFVVGDREFHAHKMVLASESEYFKSLLYGKMKEATLKKIRLSKDNVTPDAFEKILQFVYKKSLDITEPLEDILDLFRAADYLCFESFKLKLGEHLISNVDSETALQLYVFSHSYNLQKLSEKCLEQIEKDPKNILKTKDFVDLPDEYLIELISRDTFVVPESNVLQGVLKWKAHNERSFEDMKEITKCIRLSRFTLEEIFTIVLPSGLFSETSLLERVRIQVIPDLSMTQPRGRISPANLLNATRPILYQRSDDIQFPHHYLVNYLSFEMDPGVRDPSRFTHFNYSISVANNGYRRKLELFNYHYQCRGRQVLFFPTIPVNSVTITVTNMVITNAHRYSDAYRRVTCIKLSENIPFRLKSRGVIAPLCDYKVEFTSFPTRENNMDSVEAFFYQPYSASKLIIAVTHNDPNASFFDVNVLILGEKGNSQTPTKKLEHTDIREPIVVEFEERVIGYVKVELTAIALYEQGRGNDGRVSITSIHCRSSATKDDVDMSQWTPFLTSSYN